MKNNNLIQTKNILNMNNTNFSNSIRDSNFPRYNNLFSETNYSNYRRERDSFYNSLNNINNINNISTSISSLEKINYNNPYRLSQSRSRSPCLCGCHSHEECLHHLNELSTPIIYPREQLLQSYNNSLANMNEEMNKKNDDLINEITYLKKNLAKIETELNRTKNEKDACNYYIKELEKELSKSNMSNELQNSKKRAMNYAKMRDYEKYHDMLNKSFEVLDSVSNQCTDPKGKTKGGVNYYFNKEKDYDSVIKTQKNWINNLPMSMSQENENIDKEKEQYEPNKYQSESNIYKYPEGYINMSTGLTDERKKLYNIKNNNSQNNIIPKRYYNSNQDLNYNNKSLPKRNYSNNNNTYTYINQAKQNNSNPKRNDKQYQSDFFPKHIMYKTNNRKNVSKSPQYRNNSQSNAPKKSNNTYPYLSNSNIDNNIPNNELNNIPSKERYLVIDKFGNPIFISGKRLLAMELVPYLDKDGKEQLDNNENILFIGPDGNPKTQDDLQPIILDNGKPLVNEENRPFLGIDNVIMVNRFGNPILGPGELYDANNKVVKGELGILPKTNKGNLIKLNIDQESLIKDDENNNINNKEPYNNYATPKQTMNKNDKINTNNNNSLPLEIKPLLGSDGKPIRDKNNNPIFLDKDGNPIQDPNIKLLLDKSGFPILNTLGQPIILDKNKNPLDISTSKNQVPNNNIRISYNNKYPEAKEKKLKTKNKKIRKKSKKGILSTKNNKQRAKSNYGSTQYPKPNPSFQRKLNILPERSNRFNSKEYLSTCFACDLGCSVSRSGYSPMTYSPYGKKEKRRDLTPLNKLINE